MHIITRTFVALGMWILRRAGTRCATQNLQMIYISTHIARTERWQSFLALVGEVLSRLAPSDQKVLFYAIKLVVIVPEEQSRGKRSDSVSWINRSWLLSEKEKYFACPERFAKYFCAIALHIIDERSARWPKKFAKEWAALIGPSVPVRGKDGKLMGFDHLRAWIKPKESEPAPTPEIGASS